MKRVISVIQIIIFVSGLLSCSGEDSVEVNIHDPNAFFEPNPNVSDEESQIRRAFTEKYGAYLLFNDTIQKNFIGYDINGDSVYRVELVSIDYTIGQTAYASNKYTYHYLSSIEDKKEAVAFLEQYVLIHITNKLMPYSWMLCSQINYDESQHPYAAAGQRCIVVSTGLLSRLKTEAQRAQYVSRIINAILSTLVNKNISSFADFFAVSKGYYGLTITASTEAILRNYAREHGFLDKVNGLWNTNTPSEEEDLDMFCTYLLTYNDEYIETTFKDYPLVLKKWNIFKDVMYSLGFRQ